MSEDSSVAAMTPQRPKPIRLTTVMLYGGLVNGVVVAAFSGDFACSAIGAAILGGMIAAAAAMPFRRLRQRRWSILVALALVVAITAFAQTVYIRRALLESAFRDGFGIDPPAEARDVHCNRYYAGGPGDTITLLRFQADPAVIARLVAAFPQPATPDVMFLEFQAGRVSWAQAWNSSFSLASSKGCPWWPDAPPMTRPMHFTHSRHPYQSATMIWDAQTGIAYVMITFG